MKKICLRIDQQFGEKVRQHLIHHNLLDHDFPILQEERQLFFPLRRKLTLDELENLTIPKTSIAQVQKELEARERKPTDLESALEGQLPETLLEFLPHSLDIIGEIAIVELDEQLNPYAPLIGKALMVVNPRVTTVFAKEGGVTGRYRLRPLRHIAGEKQTRTIHQEYGVRIAVDVANTYFSPRLGTEHIRIARLIEQDEVILDMFTGVGPFALLAAKHHPVKVYAVDVNEHAINCLKESLTLNQLTGEVIPIVGNCRDVVETKLKGKMDRVIMNLPYSALEFLDAATKALNPSRGMIHFYGTITETTSLTALGQQVMEELAREGWRGTIQNSRRVRPSAPYEYQVVLDLQVEAR